MNKCNVQFICTARENKCDFWVFHSQTTSFQCRYYYEGCCTNKQAQIDMLIQEGLIKPYDIIKSNSIGG